MTSLGRKRRHPVRWVGAKMIRDYVQVPNALVRDERVTNAAFRVAVLLRSHVEGFPTSVVDIADTLNCSRNTVISALECLESLRWVVIRDTRTLDAKGLVHSEYVQHASRQLTPEEVAELGETILVPRALEPAQKVNRLTDDDAHACSEIEQESCSKIEQAKPVQKLSTKEDHLENHFRKPVPQCRSGEEAPPDDDRDCIDDDQFREVTELPDGWCPSDIDIQAMVRETRRSRDFIAYETQKFVDDYRSTTARRGMQSDWRETWRRWILKAARESA
ncbi:hypothetical protein BH09ACT8_BH09ACT8_30920 [soil metagenome]